MNVEREAFGVKIARSRLLKGYISRTGVEPAGESSHICLATVCEEILREDYLVHMLCAGHISMTRLLSNFLSEIGGTPPAFSFVC